jgi:genome maintenance exonuclease 1
MLVPHESPFQYRSIERLDSDEGRQYVLPSNKKVPSVTTILDVTKDKQGLKAWEEREGASSALAQKEQAARIGTHMHHALECILSNTPLPMHQEWDAVRGYGMAFKLAGTYFPNLSAVYGLETGLYYEDRYAGTADLIGVYRGKLAIVDFKQSVKPKRYEFITDYFHQLAAYALAHNQTYGTDIRFGAVLIAVQDGTTQEFTTTGNEFESFKYQWLRRVTEAERCLGTSS